MNASVQNGLSESKFFDLLNLVLQMNKREPLTHASPQVSSIQIRDSDRVLQILAGPGSGKTEVLVWRVLYELFVNQADPTALLVTTFTRKAGTELEVRLVERADDLLAIAHEQGIPLSDPHVHDIRVGTIHSLCDSLLAEFDPDYMASGVQLIDESELLVRMIRQYRFTLGYQSRPHFVDRVLNVEELLCLFRAPWMDETRWPTTNLDRARFLIDLIAQHTETWIPRCTSNGTPNGIEAFANATGLTQYLKDLQRRWEEYLDRYNLLDFSTIQKRFVERQHLLANKFKHIFVDEFQDSNPIQFLLHTNWLKSPDCRLTVVGDDDQAVYRFRGSDLACFIDLEPYCKKNQIPYRQEKLEINYRSTGRIVAFCQGFKAQSVLHHLSMPKNVRASSGAPKGSPVRLLSGSWEDICTVVAQEIDTMGAGTPPVQGRPLPDSVGILMFSTSERTSQRNNWEAPAVAVRSALEAKGLRVYNPRAKTAAEAESPVGQLLGLISYLIDPVSKAPLGKNGRMVEVFATHSNSTYRSHAKSVPPNFRISAAHATLQKKFRKHGTGSIDRAEPNRQAVLDYIDSVRDELVRAYAAGKNVRLSLSGFVARLLAQPFFRGCGFTIAMFRQALFTQVLEANIAPTRLTQRSLDAPLGVSQVGGKYRWDDRYWNFLNVMGPFISDSRMDDLEVEAFEEHAVPLITFHQAKGLEMDHVYIAGLGREPDISPALRTALFSGKQVQFISDDGHPVTNDPQMLELAEADREREVYVGMTRAKKTLTLLMPTDRNNDFILGPHPVIEKMFKGLQKSPHPLKNTVTVQEWNP